MCGEPSTTMTGSGSADTPISATDTISEGEAERIPAQTSCAPSTCAITKLGMMAIESVAPAASAPAEFGASGEVALLQVAPEHRRVQRPAGGLDQQLLRRQGGGVAVHLV